MAFIFISSWYKLMGSLLLIFSIWNFDVCSCSFESETFKTCGIFLRDFQPSSITQGDIVHKIIEQLQLKHLTRPMYKTIRNELSQRDIHPSIFRSMKYDCYLYAYIYLGDDLFSTLPSLGDDLISSVLYKNGLFFIFFTKNPFEMFTHESRKLRIDRQYRIFVFRFRFYKNRTKQFELNEAYFFCPFCLTSLIRLNCYTLNVLSLTVSNFQLSWAPELTNHYYLVYDSTPMKNEKLCRQQNAMYMYKRVIKCLHHIMVAPLIVSASGSNFTLKFYPSRNYNYSRIPTLYAHAKSYHTHLHHKYLSPVLAGFGTVSKGTMSKGIESRD